MPSNLSQKIRRASRPFLLLLLVALLATFSSIDSDGNPLTPNGPPVVDTSIVCCSEEDKAADLGSCKPQAQKTVYVLWRRIHRRLEQFVVSLCRFYPRIQWIRGP